MRLPKIKILKKYFADIDKDVMDQFKKTIRAIVPTHTNKYEMKYTAWRKSKGVKYCRDCGKRLTKTVTHHYVCNECWEIDRLRNTL